MLTALYGCGTKTMTQNDRERLLRWGFKGSGISWTDSPTNEELLTRVKESQNMLEIDEN